MRAPARLEWLRRLAAPAMAAGAGLVLIGAVGASGIVNGLGSLGMQAASRASDATDTARGPVPGAAASAAAAPGSESNGGVYGSRSAAPRSLDSGGKSSPAPVASQRETAFEPATKSSDEQPWLTFLIAGVALFATSAVLRFSIAPGAG
jgi:hypothetical protein